MTWGGCVGLLAATLILYSPIFVMGSIGLVHFGSYCTSRVDIYLCCEVGICFLTVLCVTIADFLYVRDAETLNQGLDRMKKAPISKLQGLLGLIEFGNMICGTVLVFTTSTDECNSTLWWMALGCLIVQYISVFIVCCCLGCLCCCATLLVAAGIASGPPAGTAAGTDGATATATGTATDTTETATGTTPTTSAHADDETGPLLHSDPAV
ncbi:hypothetical protein Pelo_1269 [Pelomyxa schiedti]|nr:hypothetical protein Pelo_1269 [Pelomyxa schiedti]